MLWRYFLMEGVTVLAWLIVAVGALVCAARTRAASAWAALFAAALLAAGGMLRVAALSPLEWPSLIACSLCVRWLVTAEPFALLVFAVSYLLDRPGNVEQPAGPVGSEIPERIG